MARQSAGILLYRIRGDGPEVLLVHPGGPFWTKKDEGAWSIPKGEHEPGEDALDVALREFAEETGVELERTNRASFAELGTVRQRSGKNVSAWGVEGELDPSTVRSNTFTLEWPPKSGRLQEFPEVDRVEWFSPEVARNKINPAQAEFVDRLLRDVLRASRT